MRITGMTSLFDMSMLGTALLTFIVIAAVGASFGILTKYISQSSTVPATPTATAPTGGFPPGTRPVGLVRPPRILPVFGRRPTTLPAKPSAGGFGGYRPTAPKPYVFPRPIGKWVTTSVYNPTQHRYTHQTRWQSW